MNNGDSIISQVKQSWITALSLVIAALAVVATTGGILTAFGHTHQTFLTLRGETIRLQGGGLYGHESVSVAAQGVGMDLVTLFVATPLLLLASYLAARGSLRGQLLRVAAFWYFTYSYLVITFGVAYNSFFLIYVALLSASLAGLILSLLSVDVGRVTSHMSPRFARRTIASIVLVISGMFLLLWLGRIVPSIATGAPPIGLESYTTLSVQAADLGIVIPLSIVTGILMLRRQSIGYLLAFPVVLFTATMGLGLVGMVMAMAALGTPVGLADAVPAVATAVLGLAMSVHLVRNVRQVVPGFRSAKAGLESRAMSA
ncbi:MAG TPA: hypothetical protein VN973_07415 [Candidatus Dormibacteraeota bacterium]|nr:hypothetical protein [Candidatus Dormibacteraeota bacterium]